MADAQLLDRRIEVAQSGIEGRRRGALAGVWIAFLLAILGFLVIYPVLTLLLGALTDTNPVVDGLSLRHLSISNFLTVLTNPNVAEALFNTLVACGGGTAIAVAIGLLFSWIVVRTNTPFRGFIAAASILPLFAPPLVAGVAWSILGSPKTGLINTAFKWAGLDWHVNFYSLWGLVFVFGIYYAPYVYMFTSSALRNMDPSLEEAAEISGASAFSTLFTVTFPLIMPAIVSGMLLSFIVMLGIYGVPAVLGAPANINVLTTYIFKLTNWSPPLYNTAAAVAIILMVVTGALVYLQQRVLERAQLHHRRRQGVPAAQPRSRAVALADLPAWAVVPARCRRAADAGADRGGVPQIHVHPRYRGAVRHARLLADAFQRDLRQSADHAIDLQRDGGRHHHRHRRRRARLCDRLHHPSHQFAGPALDRSDLDGAGRDPRPRGRRRLSLGLDRHSRRALRHDLDPGARLHRALHAGHREIAFHLVHADSPGARGSGLGLRQGTRSPPSPPSCCRWRAPA